MKKEWPDNTVISIEVTPLLNAYLKESAKKSGRSKRKEAVDILERIRIQAEFSKALEKPRDRFENSISKAPGVRRYARR